MLPHLEPDRSERSGRRWIARAAPVMGAVVLIAASVAGITYQALAATVDAQHTDDAAIVKHACHHADGCDGTTVKHACRHADGCDNAIAKHTCHHAANCPFEVQVQALAAVTDPDRGLCDISEYLCCGPFSHCGRDLTARAGTRGVA